MLTLLLRIKLISNQKFKYAWIFSALLAVLAGFVELVSAATFSLLSSSVLGGRKSSLGILAQLLPFSVTYLVLLILLIGSFIIKLIIQWYEIRLRTFAATSLYESILAKQKYSKIRNTEGNPIGIGLTSRIHLLIHNVFYPITNLVSESVMVLILLPFLVFMAPKAMFVIMLITVIFSFPMVVIVGKKLVKLNSERRETDLVSDQALYEQFRIFEDLGKQNSSIFPVRAVNESAKIDRKIVLYGSYSRFIVELNFIISVFVTLYWLDNLVEKDARIQFFALLAYSFFRIVPSFSRILTARNQISSFGSQFLEISDFNNSNRFQFSEIAKSHILSGFTIFSHDINNVKHEFTYKLGNWVLIKGNSGSGKTTLINRICGLSNNGYQVELNSDEVIDPQKWSPQIGLVSQAPYLLGETLVEMVTGRESLDATNLDWFLEVLRISDVENHDFRNRILSNRVISGGQRKKIALARALFQRPQLLVLDELAAGIDVKSMTTIMSNLRDSEFAQSLIMVAHGDEFDGYFNEVVIQN